MQADRSATSRTPWGTPTHAPPDDTTGLSSGTGLRLSFSLHAKPGIRVQDRGLEAGLIAAPGGLSTPPGIPGRAYRGPGTDNDAIVNITGAARADSPIWTNGDLHTPGNIFLSLQDCSATLGFSQRGTRRAASARRARP